jgi:hypothetical protein
MNIENAVGEEMSYYSIIVFLADYSDSTPKRWFEEINPFIKLTISDNIIHISNDAYTYDYDFDTVEKIEFIKIDEVEK